MVTKKRKRRVTKGAAMEVETVPIDDLKLDSRNARKGSIGPIAESLQEFGQHRPAVVQRGTNKIIAGNHMVKAAKSIGWDEIAVVFVDDDDEQSIRRAIADNATGDLATWDEAVLKSLMDEVGTDIPGVTDDLLEQLQKATKEVEDDDGPTYPIVPRMNEKYGYVVIVAESEVDCAWLETTFGLQKEQSYKNSKIGISRVVTVSRLQAETRLGALGAQNDEDEDDIEEVE